MWRLTGRVRRRIKDQGAAEMPLRSREGVFQQLVSHVGSANPNAMETHLVAQLAQVYMGLVCSSRICN